MSTIQNDIKYRNGIKFAILFTTIYFIVGVIGISIVNLFVPSNHEWVFLFITTAIMFYIALRFIYRAHEQIRQLVEQKLVLTIYKSIFDQMHEGLVITNEKEEILTVNPSFTVLTGFREDEVLGKKPAILSSGIHSNEFYVNMKKELRKHGRWQGEVFNQRKNGQIYPEQLSISEIRNQKGVITNFIGVFTDISSQRTAEGKIEFLTHYDSKTRLPKFNLFMKHLTNFINDVADKDNKFSLFIIDTAKLKDLNATYGHKVGDELLQTLAIRLKSRYKEFIVGRLNSKEFAVIIPTLYEEEETNKEAQDLLHAIEFPYYYEGEEFFLSATIGIGIYPDHGLSADELYKNATLAKTAAKEISRQYLLFGDQLLSNIRRKVSLEKYLIKALDLNEFHVYYQPQIKIETNKLIGLEALIRWNHSKLGMISPAEFIPLAEESGLILEIGEWVLETVCEQIKKWQQAGIFIPKVAVNLSPKQFQNPNLLMRTKEIINKTKIDPALIEFEITENISLFQTETIINTITNLKKLGVKISIDDFGTGHSCLSYLQQLPIDHLKIDRSFILDIPNNKNNIALTKAIIAMAHELNISVVAEGVETKEQLEFLDGQHCEYAQGFYFSRPIPPEEIINFCTVIKSKS